MKPKISIIVPVYNVEKYLEKCLDSILRQTFTEFELILVNDGSTDKSGLICDEYVKLDNNIKLIYDSVLEKCKESNFLFTNLVSKIDSLSPLKVLSRGYSIVKKEDSIINNSKSLSIDDVVSIRLADGEVKAKIIEV